MASACTAVIYIVTYMPYLSLMPYSDRDIVAARGPRRIYMSLIPNTALPLALECIKYSDVWGWDYQLDSELYYNIKFMLIIFLPCSK